MNDLLLKRLEHLSPERRELVLKRLSAASGKAEQGVAILSVSREQAMPLSSAQTRLWFLDQQLESWRDIYNVPLFLQLHGHLQVTALERAIAEIIQRHEILRTTFSALDGAPVQVIAPNLTLPLTIIDLQAWPETEKLAEAHRLAYKELQKPLDLAHGPLLRVTLLRLNRHAYVLLVVMHHIVCDGWSMSVFSRELAALYTAFCAGQSSPLPDLPLQYADFAHWQQQALNSETLQTQRHYWQRQLAGTPPLLELPTDRPRPSVSSHRGQSTFLPLGQELTQNLLHLSQASGATLFMTLLAAFAILLSRYCRQEDVVIGSPIANRNRKELEALIGFFVNTLVLRTDLHGDPDFTSLLKRVRQMTLDAYAHQDVPFEKLVDDLQPVRSLSYHPLFQVSFDLQNAPRHDPVLPGLTITPFAWENATALFDLSVTFKETEQGLLGAWEYATDLFEPATIQRMTHHFEALLCAIVAHPDHAISTLPMLTPAEQQQLQAWNHTDTDFPQDLTVVDLFEQQVEKAPDNIAVVFDKQRLTYRQLNDQANQLAHALRRFYAALDTPGLEAWLAAICIEPSPEMVVGLLGILKAGAAYVPIDPHYPHERIRFMLEDAAAPVLLTQTALKDYLPLSALDPTCQVLYLDENSFTEESTQNLTPRIQPGALTYVIYTSGSTGQPKGVMVEHRSLINLVHWHLGAFGIQSRDKATLLASIAFDASVWELWPYLAAGASVYPVPRETRLSTSLLAQWLDQHGITVAFLPTPLVANWEPSQATPTPNLRLILTGGDMLHRAPGHLPCALVNNYGPTENTVVATSTPVTAAAPPTIGHPIDNVRIYILDRRGQPLPIGIPGELCVAGSSLARGYLKQPDLTAAHFIEIDLFGRSERLYKTGDLARWLPDGSLEFLGRLDNQVSLRGFRIELGEIETVLCQHEAVKESVAILNEANSNLSLVAYVAGERTPKLPEALKTYLKTRLPDYMIPSQITVLDALPLTANGKIDRSALPAPDQLVPAHFEPPITTTEALLATLWAEVLQQASIGRHANFFDMGGHSLLATKLMTRIRNHFAVELPVRAIFESPTLSELANALDLYGWAISNTEAAGDLSEEEEEFEL